MIYQRKISAEEALLGKILITKDAWKRLPQPGAKVRIKFRGQRVPATIEASACACRGPLKPHEHYYFILPEETPLVSGQNLRLEIEETEEAA
jgi:hypothetical protein